MPLNYLVKVAEIKKILLLSLEKNESSKALNSLSIGYDFVCFDFLLAFFIFFYPVSSGWSNYIILNMSSGTSNNCSVGNEFKLNDNFCFFPCAFI